MRNTDSIWDNSVWTHFWPLLIFSFESHYLLICWMKVKPLSVSRADKGRKSRICALPSPWGEVGGAVPPRESSSFSQLPSPGNRRWVRAPERTQCPQSRTCQCRSVALSLGPFPPWFPFIFLHSSSCHTAHNSDTPSWMSIQGTPMEGETQISQSKPASTLSGKKQSKSLSLYHQRKKFSLCSKTLIYIKK